MLKVRKCRLHVTLNGGPLEELDCFKYLWSQVAADGCCKWDVHNERGGIERGER